MWFILSGSGLFCGGGGDFCSSRCGIGGLFSFISICVVYWVVSIINVLVIVK